MILFAEDFLKYPSAIIDTRTSNESFLRLAAILQKMGIRNNAFFLALLQPQLQGVDPHSNALTEEQMTAIGLECQYNPWYFFREVAKLPPRSGITPVPFKANRGNISCFFSYFNHMDYSLIQPRQTHKSGSVDCLTTWLLCFRLWNSRINLLTKDAELRMKNVERLKMIGEILPPYLYRLQKDDADNQHIVTYKERGNEFITAVSQASEARALNVGRGITSETVIVDESPYIANIMVTMPALLMSTLDAREQAKRNNAPYGNLFTTTAGKRDEKSGAYMYKLIFNGSIWTERFYDCQNQQAFEELVKKNCRGKKAIINGTFSHRQLGYTDDWLREAIALSNGTQEDIERDLLNIWTMGKRRSPIHVELNKAIRESEMEPLYHEITRHGYIWRWYIPEDYIDTYMSANRLTLGIDTSEAIGQDDIGLVLTNVSTLETVAAATINETNIIIVAKFIVDIIVRYPSITVIIERKSTGIAIIDALLIELPMHGIDPFRRMYNRLVDEADSRQNEFKIVLTDVNSRGNDVYNYYKRDFGFVTTAQSRNILYGNTLQQAAKRGASVVRDSTLSEQIRGLQVKNGRIDHGDGEHDDMVIAWLLNVYLITLGKNLDYYGIDTRECLALAGDSGRVLSPEQVKVREQQKALRVKIKDIQEQLKQAKDGFAIMRLEAQLRNLSEKTRADGGDLMSIDALLKEVEEYRNDTSKAHRKDDDRFQVKHRRKGNDPDHITYV